MSYRSVSYWFDSLGAEPEPRSPLPGDLEVDVAIVGGGFTGLWTAYYLMRADPACRVAVIERETAGFGASGRNGGWCVALIHGLQEYFERDPERGAALREAIKASVDEVGAVCEAEGIEADFHKGGGLSLATCEQQAERLRAYLETERKVGWTEEDVRWLDPAEVAVRIRASSIHAGVFNANTAAVNPAKLARGVADAAERRGAAIYEQTTALAVEPGRVRTSRGSVRAPRIVMALDAHVTRLPACRRNLMPVYEHMIATEPLSDQIWQEIGLAERGLFGDFNRLFTYAQRTADNRIAIGGRNFDYTYGSKIDARFERNPRVERLLVDALREMLPQLGAFAITHRWGGVLGIPRDFTSAISIDEATGIACVQSYAGEGVCPSNLAGRTLCDFALGRETPLTELPWVGHRSPKWEPEPLRWLGARAARTLLVSADRAEERGRRHPVRRLLLRAMDLDQ
ncbi:MAG: FAD-dependent oxidoreductase [Deltaproteobacteria bacterium]|jgi:glycine/D-amino acid oxidase-like deaminating enzyme|nr:FAD-dependent oxidoreductase [Deltaproteobacteria bacterium]